MKKSKLFILIILFIFITGCGYKDIYEENQEALDNLNCSYTSEDYYSYSAYPTSNYTITVTADSKGVYFTHEKLKTNIINNSVKLGSYYLRFSENELKSFLESYKANGCPNQFFAAAKAGDTQYLHVQSTCAAGDGVNTQCFLYKLNDKSESKPQHTISKSPTYNRYIKAIKKQVKYSFSYDFDSKTSFLEVDGVTYEIKDKSLMEPISETTNYWAVYPTDYNDIFKIDKTNKTVDWPELVYVMQKSKDQYQYQVLYFTIDLEEYEVRNDFYDENEARSAIAGNWDPDKLCDDDKCNIDITAFCLNPYVARTLKFLGILIAIVI